MAGMKRLGLVIGVILLWAGSALAYDSASKHYQLQDYSISGTPASGVAAAATPAADCVKIGNPVSGSTNCVDNTGSSGALGNYLKDILKYVGGLFGIAVVLMIVISGIQYITSSGNEKAVQAARGRLVNAVIGLVLFLMMFGILHYLIPGTF